MLNETISKTYLIAGYVVILTILGLYIISLFVRWHNLKRDLQTLKEIRNKD